MTATGWPLTEAQEGIWYAQAQDTGSAAFNTGQVLWIEGALDRAALRQAVAQLCHEAPALSLRFVDGAEGGAEGPMQCPGPAPHLRDAEVADEAALRAALWDEALTPFDLRAGPPARFTLWRLADGRHALSQCLHHLVADGFANTMITRRITQLYAHLTGAGPAPRAMAGFDTVTEADSAYRTAPERAEARAWWQARLTGCGSAAGFKPGRAVASHSFLRAEGQLPAEAVADLKDLARAAGVNWADALTVLVAAYCARLTEGASRPGIPMMNRMGSALAGVVASLVNVLPFDFAHDETAPLVQVLAEGGAALAEMRRNGRYRGEALRRDLGLIGGDRRLFGPLINVLPFDPTPRMAGLETRLDILGAGSVDDLTVHLRGDGRGALLVQVDANPALYDQPEAEAHLARLLAFVRRAVGAARLADVPTLTEAETHQHVVARNATDHPVPDTTLAALIEAQMRATPDAPALVFGDQTLSYAALEARSATLAHGLAARGVGPGARVAVALPRSLELLVALVAIERVGAAYVPLDPEDGSARRADMLTRAEPALVLAEAGFPHAEVWAPADWPQDCAPDTHLQGPAPQDPAYVLFTSGSTGRPKGVVVSHRAIVTRLLWMQAEYGIGPGDRILQKTPMTFDVSVWEFFLPLLSGATLVIAPPGAHRDPRALAGLIRTQDITALHFVPSMLAVFLDAPEAQGLAPRHVFASGEALPTALARRFHQVMRGRLHNLYGPTEAAVDVSYHEATGAEVGASVPIGRPVWNTRLYLLDDHLRPVPDGVAGRLFLAGRQLAEGYLGQPDLTAERFVPDPFVPGARMYDAGDIARMDAAGVITYEGRADGQVKIRGVRIETGEIEAALLAHPGVAQAVVLARADATGTDRLIGWVVPTAQAGADLSDALTTHLAAHLPQAMLPAALVVLPELPLTPNGKLDRRALPDPQGTTTGRAPAPGAETLLAGLYAEVLGLAQPADPETDFFLAGGDSLRAVRLTLRIEAECGFDPGLAAVFETPVLADLARRIAARQVVGDGLGPMLQLSRGKRAPLFAIHPAGGIGWCYRGLAAALTDRPVIALQSPLLEAGAEVPDSLDALAQRYAAQIQEAAPEGPVHLIGWSLGGLIAQAAACHLAEAGREVGLVGLLDSYPAACWRALPDPGPEAALRALLAIAGIDPEAHPEITTRDQILGLLRSMGHPLAQLPEAAIAGVIRSVQQTNRLVRGHHEARYRGRVLHVQAALDHQGSDLTPALWQPFVGALEVTPLPCLHGTLLAPEVRVALASALEAEMARSVAAPAVSADCCENVTVG